MRIVAKKIAGLTLLTIRSFLYSEGPGDWPPDTQARILGGFELTGKNPELTALREIGWPGKENLAAHWGKTERYRDGTTNLSSPENRKLMDTFFSHNLGPARRHTKNLLYLFGGPDVYFPNLLFPNHSKLVLVGLEKPGKSCNPFSREGNRLLAGMVELSRTYRTIFRLGYFNTGEMAGHLREVGAAPVICAGLVAQGFRITKLDPVSLDKNGTVTPANKRENRGIRISYLKQDGTTAEVIYLNVNLSNAALEKAPEFATFLTQTAFQTAYYKAASYLSHSEGQFGKINELVLTNVTHIVQSDDGIPLRAFDRSWRLRLFGIYTKPDRQFAIGSQDDLKALYAAEICRSGTARDKYLWNSLWQSDCKEGDSMKKFHTVSWGGTMPFHYGYAGFSGPGLTRTNRPPAGLIITSADTAKWSNLMVADKIEPR